MSIKIMTFNLRYDKPDPGDRAWSHRRNAVAQLIQTYSPDIIGTQEGKAHQLLELHRRLPHYQSVGCDRQGDGTGEYCAIFYRAERFTCRSEGNFWLSDTPDIPGSITPSWGNPFPRMVTWAIFSDRSASDRPVCIYNTHLDYNSADARDRGTQLICDRLQNHDRQDAALFLTADFNCPPDAIPRQRLSQLQSGSIHLVDVFAEQTIDPQLTYHDFAGTASDPIDSIYYDQRLKLTQVQVDRQQWTGVWPSDHFPVCASFDG